MTFNLTSKNLNEPMQELPGAALADLIAQLAEAVAEGQARLDLSSAQVLQELAQTRVSIVPSIRQTIAEGGTVSYEQAEPVEVSLLELGMLPTFFAFSEATVEVAMDLKVVEEIKSSETIKSQPILFAATRSLQTERRLNRDVRISTKIAAKLVPVPPPSRFNVTLDTVTVPSPPPTLAASPNQFAPKQGIPGTQVTLFGNNLNFGTPRVRFGKTAATIIGTPTANQIVVAVPSLPIGPFKITVKTDAGSTTCKDTFNVVPLPVFAASPFTPKQGTPGTQVTLSGSNFNVGTPQVSFGKTAATVIDTPTANQIVVAVPSLPSGAVRVTVETDGGAVVSGDTFNVVNPPAFDASPNQFTPKQGTPGTQMTLFGSNFNVGNPQVSFGTTAATVIGTPTANQIVVAVPSLPVGAVKIAVQTDAGTVTSSDTFNLISAPPPAFDASPNQFTPKRGTPGTQVTLSGSNFNVRNPQVSFGETAATVIDTLMTNGDGLVVAVPSLSPGKYKITVQTSAGSIASTDTFLVRKGLPIEKVFPLKKPFL